MMDKYDAVLFVPFICENKEGIYSHIILDDLEKYTKAEIDFIRRLFNKKNIPILFLL